ncbi:retrovirus-related pol polyprotein from transposon TNT 1-94 [Tanacetum coccineum]
MSLSLVKNVIVVGADNRPPILDKTQYSSWANLTEPRTQTTPATVRDRIYDELTNAEKICEACDIKATNTVLRGLPQDIYNLVNHHDEDKHIWDRVKLLIEGSRVRSNAIGSSVNRNRGTSTAVPTKVIRCYNCQEEGHMARQCTKPKRPRNSTWFKEKAMLAGALKSKVVLDEEQMEFLGDNGDKTFSQRYQLMIDNHVTNQSVQEMQYSEQPIFNNDIDIDITSDSNMISYEQYLKETENAVVQDTSSAQQDALMYAIEEMSNKVIVDKNAKVVDFKNQIHSLKLLLNATVESHKTLSTTVDVLKMEAKEKEDKYLEEIIELENKKKALNNVVYKMGQSTQTMHMLTKPQAFYDESHKTTLGYQNPLYLTQAQRKVLALYCGHTIVKKHDTLFVIDTEETLKFPKETRLKMHAKQNDSIAKEKKVNIAPIDYAALNKLSEHFLEVKYNSINKLKDHIATLKGKSVSKGHKFENISKVITPGMYKLDLEPLSRKLLNNMEAHVDYLKHTQKNADILREIVEQARALRP